MDVRCERCRAQYVFDDEQVTAGGLTVQCTNCGHLFKVKKKELVVTVPVKPDDVEGTPVSLPGSAPRADAGAAVAPRPSQAAMPAAPPRPATRASVPAMPAAPAPGAPPPADPERPREWRVRQANGNIFTFRELTTLQKWIIEQKVGRDDEISLSGDQWKRLGNIAELASFFQVVEAAERSRSQAAMPAAPAMPALTPLPMPVYGVAVQTPGLYPPPPPPSGFPPPSFAAPPPTYAGIPAAHATATVAAAPEPVAPAQDVDLVGMDEAPRKRGARPWLLAVLGVVAAGAGAFLALPYVLPKPPPPPVVRYVSPTPPPPREPPPPPPPPEPIVKPVAKPPAPKGPKVLLARAKALLARGDAEEALELFGRVASDDPGNVEAQAGRGLCYLDLENWAPAEASFQAALRIEPDHADALLGLAETFRFQGKRSEAIASYERYLARYPGSDEAEVAKNALAELRK